MRKEPATLDKRLAFSVKEAADALGVCIPTFRKLLDSGRIQSTKLGARRLVSRASLERFVSSGHDLEATSVEPQKKKKSRKRERLNGHGSK